MEYRGIGELRYRRSACTKNTVNNSLKSRKEIWNKKSRCKTPKMNDFTGSEFRWCSEHHYYCINFETKMLCYQKKSKSSVPLRLKYHNKYLLTLVTTLVGSSPSFCSQEIISRSELLKGLTFCYPFLLEVWNTFQA